MNYSYLLLNERACANSEFDAPKVRVVYASDHHELVTSLGEPGLVYAACAAYAKTPGPQALLDSLEKRMREILKRTIQLATPCVGIHVSVPVERELGLGTKIDGDDRTAAFEIMDAYGANSLMALTPQMLYPTDCQTNDGRYIYGYMALAHLLHLLARFPVHQRDRVPSAAISNSRRVERITQSFRPWLDAVGNTFFKTEVHDEFLSLSFDTTHKGAWPIVASFAAVIDLDGEHTLRRISLDTAQARMLYALYPDMFVGKPVECMECPPEEVS